MQSKQLQLLGLFFNEPTKHWHFETILQQANITRSKASNWLKQFQQEHLIQKIKPEHKMPYYISNYEAPNYQQRKRLFAQQQLYDSGLLTYLNSLQKAETVILFGSFSRSDWYKNSDIDIFIYGNTTDLHLFSYQTKLHREIQVFQSKNSKDLQRYGSGLIQSIINGVKIKGSIPKEVFEHATT